MKQVLVMHVLNPAYVELPFRNIPNVEDRDSGLVGNFEAAQQIGASLGAFAAVRITDLRTIGTACVESV
jgi:hypothetical protein